MTDTDTRTGAYEARWGPGALWQHAVDQLAALEAAYTESDEAGAALAGAKLAISAVYWTDRLAGRRPVLAADSAVHAAAGRAAPCPAMSDEVRRLRRDARAAVRACLGYGYDRERLAEALAREAEDCPDQLIMAAWVETIAEAAHQTRYGLAAAYSVAQATYRACLGRPIQAPAPHRSPPRDGPVTARRADGAALRPPAEAEHYQRPRRLGPSDRYEIGTEAHLDALAAEIAEQQRTMPKSIMQAAFDDPLPPDRPYPYRPDGKVTA